MELEVNLGWVKIFRSFTKWEWWDDHNTSRLFIWLLVSVNFEEKKWKGITIRPGQIVTGRKVIAAETGLSEDQVRLALTKLERTQVITRESLGFSSKITVLNWEKYQADTRENPDKSPSHPQVPPKSSPPLKNEKKEKNIYSSFDLEAVYALYPKKEGKKKGLESLCKQIKTDEQYESLKLAVQNYADKVLSEGTEVKYQKHFSTFANCWGDYVTIEKSMSAQDLARKAELELEAKFNKMDEEAIAKLGGAND